MTINAWVGIDAACAKGKYLPISICTRQSGRLVPLKLKELPGLAPPRGMGNALVIESSITRAFALDAVRYVRAVAEHYDLRVNRIAIDAPSNYTAEGVGRRAAELSLDAAGISCFTTPTKHKFGQIVSRVRKHIADGRPISRVPHANQLWMLAGFALFEAFSTLGECREVYPQAIARALNAADIHKGNQEGLVRQLVAASTHTGWPSGRTSIKALDYIGFARRHDNLDAYLSAWVASLGKDELIAFGKPPHDVIWAPKVNGARFSDVRVKEGSQPTSRTAAVLDVGKQKLCPACGLHNFKRWPFGWDAHAAYKCRGLSATDPEVRKKEFRDRYSGMFAKQK